MTIDLNGDEPSIYPLLDDEGDWVEYSNHREVELRNRELESQHERYRYVIGKNEREIYELGEKVSALAGVIADLKNNTPRLF